MTRSPIGASPESLSPDVLRAPVEFALAQLRHAYSKLAAGTVVDPKQLASGLIAPTIRRLEVALAGGGSGSTSVAALRGWPDPSESGADDGGSTSATSGNSGIPDRNQP